MINFGIIQPTKKKFFDRELSVSRFIPYRCHWNSNTILTKKDELVRVVKLSGYAFETADDEDIDIKKVARNNIFKGMASGNLYLYFHTIRRKEQAYPDGTFYGSFVESLEEKWKRRHSGKKSFINEHYITLVRGSGSGGVAALEQVAKKLRYGADRSAWENDMRKACEELDELTQRIINGFTNYNPEVLGIIEVKEGFFSEALNFLSKLVNCGDGQRMMIPNIDISHYLSNSRLYFGKKSIECINLSGRKYAGVVSIKEYRPSTHAGMLDGFLQLPFELIITQSFSYIDRMIAISKMELQQRRLIQAQDVATSQISEIDEALDSAMSGRFAFGRHHLSILCIENDPIALESAISMAIVELANVGITGVRERINMEPCYWGQLPGNIDYVARRSVINSLNVASFVSMHNYPAGNKNNNHWGNAVTVLDTVSGTPYFFSFHSRDIGHTMIVGPTGAGKTVLMNFLCAQSQKFNPRMFFFDKDRGAEIFLRAIGGIYRTPSTEEVSGFNPLQLEDNHENRAFLIEFLELLVTIDGEKLAPEERAQIAEAVNGNYKLAKEDRILTNIAPFFGIETPGSIASRLKMWYGSGTYAKLFDNPVDEIDFTSSSVFGFEMSKVLDNGIAMSPVLLYLTHRINNSLDGKRTMIVLDEAWALIDNPVFAPKIKNWLKVLRKLNAMVVFATQSVEDATKSSISDTIVQQTSTQIYLPNLRATEEAYKKLFALSDREFSLVKTTDPATRFFLVKKDNEGVVARLDLSGMDDIISVLSGRSETVALLHDIIKEKGEDPEDWLEDFYEMVKNS